MAEHQPAEQPRPTIGYLAPAIHGGSLDQWLGVVDAARKHDVNLICFPGWSPNYPTGFQVQANVLYNLVTPKNVDGIITWASAIGNYMTAEEIQAFHDRYRPLPMVTIGRTLEGIPSLLMDSYEGMRKAIAHLIEFHGRRRVAFIRGPASHFYAQERYRAYTETLEAYGIPLNSNLVTPPSTWGMDVGRAETQLMLDERRLVPGKDFDAVVAANDEMILGALDVLQTRGVHIPGDVAVVGFDDRVEGRTRTPPLTSVAAPFYEIGFQSVETLLALMAGERVPEEATVPSRLVVRQSCGCLPPLVAQVVVEQRPATSQTGVSQKELEAVLLTQREEILAKMTQAAGELGESLDPTAAEQLLDGFVAELKGEPQGTFLTALDDVLRREVVVVGDATESNVVAMQSAVTAMRSSLLPCLSFEVLPKAESLWQQARLVIAETTRRVDMHLTQQAVQQSQALHEIWASLITVFDRKELMGALVEALPILEIPSAYLALYEQHSELSRKEQRSYAYPDPAPEMSRLVLAYTENGQIDLEANGLRFRSRQLVPEGILPQERRYSFVAKPLYFQNNQIGLALLEIGPREASVYEVLRVQISSALQGAALIQRVENRALQFQTVAQVSRATSSILDLDELAQQVVDVIRERFNLYYVGLFLTDQAGEGAEAPSRWAVLRAATGAAGREMIARGHRLEIADTSMVGWAVSHRQARIALDVGHEGEVVRFENPLLPDTRSEMALPLISRGEVIGALDVQSDKPEAFSDEDVAVLQTMADQVALAIGNARLFQQVQDSLEAERRAYGELSREAWQELLQVRSDLSYTYDERGLMPATAVLEPHMRVATQKGAAIIAADDERSVALPIKVRDQVIGVIDVHKPEQGAWTKEQVALLETLTEQLGVALESARLYQDTQRRAAREQLMAQVTARMRESLDMETVLRTAVNEMRQALELEGVIVQLARPETAPVADEVSTQGPAV